MSDLNQREERFNQFLEALFKLPTYFASLALRKYENAVTEVPAPPAVQLAISLGLYYMFTSGFQPANNLESSILPPAYLLPELPRGLNQIRPILVSNTGSLAGLNFVTAHELGHWLRGENAIKHKSVSDFQTHDEYWEYYTQVEVPANQLAYEILMPEYVFKKLAGKSYGSDMGYWCGVHPFHIYMRLFVLSDINCEFAVFLQGTTEPACVFKKECTADGSAVMRFSFYHEDEKGNVGFFSIPTNEDEILYSTCDGVKARIVEYFSGARKLFNIADLEVNREHFLCHFLPLPEGHPTKVADEVLLMLFPYDKIQYPCFFPRWSNYQDQPNSLNQKGFNKWLNKIRALLELEPRAYNFKNGMPPATEGDYIFLYKEIRSWEVDESENTVKIPTAFLLPRKCVDILRRDPRGTHTFPYLFADGTVGHASITLPRLNPPVTTNIRLVAHKIKTSFPYSN